MVLVIGYECRADTEGVKINWEHDDFKWRSKEEALKMDLTDDARFLINKY
jgi:hypothetical protein